MIVRPISMFSFFQNEQVVTYENDQEKMTGIFLIWLNIGPYFQDATKFQLHVTDEQV